MPDVALPDPSVFIVTIRRSARSEPETYYMPAPTAAIAELRVRRLAKAPDAAILGIHTEHGLPQQGGQVATSYHPPEGGAAAA